MDYGKKIAHLRKSKGMTQEELGRELNVTYQAVSKWERGESLPDFTTMTQIAKIFQVPIDYFVEGNENNYQEPVYSEEESYREPVYDYGASFHEPIYNTVINESDSHVGICTECGKMLTEGEVFSTSPKMICKDCAQRIEQGRLKKKQEQEQAERYRRERQREEQFGKGFDVKLIVSLVLSLICYVAMTVVCLNSDFNEDFGFKGIILFLLPLTVFGCTHAVFNFINDFRDVDDPDYRRNLSLITGGAFSAVNIICFLVLYISTKESFYIVEMVLAFILSFTFISQFMWGGVVKDIFTAGGFTFKLPGFIFSLSVESILLMLVLKVVLGFVAVVLFIITTILFCMIAILGSLFTFIPSIIIKSVKDKRDV